MSCNFLKYYEGAKDVHCPNPPSYEEANGATSYNLAPLNPTETEAETQND